MKKFMVTAVVTGLIGGAAFAQTNVVSSANVVGYNQITIPSNQYVLVALDFNNASNTVNGLFGNLPTGSEVSFWNPATQGYVSVAKTRAGWGTGGTNVLDIGAGAFLKVPAATNIYMSGDVPVNATSVLYVVTGFKVLSYPYPADTYFTNTALAKGSATGDEVSKWNNGWTTYAKTRAGWGAGTNLQLKVGEALLYKAATGRTVNEVIPYTLN